MYDLIKIEDDLLAFRDIFEMNREEIGYKEHTVIKPEFSEPKILEDAFYTQLIKFFSEDIKNIDIPREFISFGVTYDNSAMNYFLKKFIQNTLFEDFKAIINAFEKLVNSDKIYGSTNLYRTLLFRGIGTLNLKKNKNKILYIANSEILNKNDNACDIRTQKFMSKNQYGNFDNELCQHYSRYILFSWQFISLFPTNTKVMNSIYPDLVCNRIVMGYLQEELSQRTVLVKNINIDQIDKQVIVNKYGKVFLTDFQNDLPLGKLKDMINDILGNSLSMEDKKKMIIQPLMSLNIKSYKQMKKTHFEAFLAIEKLDILEVSLQALDIYTLTELEEEHLKIMKEYNLQNYDDNDDIEKTAQENAWSIIMQERILKEKKEVKKSLNPVNKTKISKKRM